MILSPYRHPEDISTGDTVLVVNQGHNTNRLYCTVVEITSNDNGSYGGTVTYPGSWAGEPVFINSNSNQSEWSLDYSYSRHIHKNPREDFRDDVCQVYPLGSPIREREEPNQIEIAPGSPVWLAVEGSGCRSVNVKSAFKDLFFLEGMDDYLFIRGELEDTLDEDFGLIANWNERYFPNGIVPISKRLGEVLQQTPWSTISEAIKGLRDTGDVSDEDEELFEELDDLFGLGQPTFLQDLIDLYAIDDEPLTDTELADMYSQNITYVADTGHVDIDIAMWSFRDTLDNFVSSTK